MRPSARIQAAIEVIDTVLTEESIPADTILTHYFRNRRYIGSQDRKNIAELVYQTLRHKIILDALWQHIPPKRPTTSGRTLMITGLSYLQQLDIESIAALFSGDAYGPPFLTEQEQTCLEKLKTISVAQLTEAEQHNIQGWQLEELKADYGDDMLSLLTALNQQAPFDLRVNSLSTTRLTVQKRLEQEEITAHPGQYSPTALRLTDRRPLGKHPLWIDGSIEVQDEGSQLIAHLVAAKPGQSVWDYCAGAGGKTLAIAALMLNQGRLIATDVVDWRLQRSRERFKRAGVHNVECHVLNETTTKWVKRGHGKFDRVLIDVPCSGSGTWRRNPDLKWRLQESGFHELLAIQASILEKAAKLVKPGGRLVYSTCSLFRSENQSQIDKFLAQHPEFSLLPITTVWQEVLPGPCPTIETTLQLRPDQHHVDGFFVCVMERQRN
ncbi:RsmB/NOP family class I SAM-dependent RNA methyltransferase [Candidatus Paracaedibacter symbiosus]|uniref:RsmB/NOP family class I SAM-dependent RNA methyltransferase n=1 Tax=Candidatus Paracaedibacter symbiosus TaxID=244582 RepID=UPI0005099B5A|nr:RsmB/NOP family class I SAM-dependent RNA methyltransferase [Candidatus Paracaedibacter symbiosus]